jgi:hypothetical protein
MWSRLLPTLTVFVAGLVPMSVSVKLARAGEHGGAVPAVVADEELLVKNRRVEIGDHVDAGPKQRRVDAAVGFGR